MARVLIVGLLAAAAVTFSGFAFTQPSSSPRVPPRATSRSAETDFIAPVVEAKELPAVSESFVNFSRAAFAVLAALAVAFVPMDGAEAARSGGRMGGMGGSRMGGSSRAAPPRAAPSARAGVGSSVGGGSTVVVAPMMSPFGFSPFGGFGYSPFGMGMGFGGGGFGPSGTDQRIQEQQRQDERNIDSQKSQIDALQKEIETLKAQKK